MHYWDFSDALHFSRCMHVCIIGVLLIDVTCISLDMYALLGFCTSLDMYALLGFYKILHFIRYVYITGSFLIS